MFDEKNTEDARSWARRVVEEAKPLNKIRIASHAENDPGDIYGMEDDDGDQISAEPCTRFDFKDTEVAVEFKRGLAPEVVARFLRKMLEMVEGPKGSTIVTLGSTKHDFDHAARLWSGHVYPYNYLDEIERMVSEDEADARAAEGAE